MKAIARTYIQTAQGTIESMNFNSTTGDFVGKVKLNVGIDANTVVHALESGKGLIWYPHGYNVDISLGAN